VAYACYMDSSPHRFVLLLLRPPIDGRSSDAGSGQIADCSIFGARLQVQASVDDEEGTNAACNSTCSCCCRRATLGARERCRSRCCQFPICTLPTYACTTATYGGGASRVSRTHYIICTSAKARRLASISRGRVRPGHCRVPRASHTSSDRRQSGCSRGQLPFTWAYVAACGRLCFRQNRLQHHARGGTQAAAIWANDSDALRLAEPP
jgi:hypothetical protein